MKTVTKKKNENPFIKSEKLKSFNSGTNYHSYEILGAWPSEIYGDKGFSFSVWAPNAAYVSVVGDFNNWNAESHPMKPQKSSGVWHCFIKGVGENSLYKFYIRDKQGKEHYKADPYARMAQLRPDTASVTYDISGYKWHDKKWIEKR